MCDTIRYNCNFKIALPLSLTNIKPSHKVHIPKRQSCTLVMICLNAMYLYFSLFLRVAFVLLHVCVILLI